MSSGPGAGAGARAAGQKRNKGGYGGRSPPAAPHSPPPHRGPRAAPPRTQAASRLAPVVRDGDVTVAPPTMSGDPRRPSPVYPYAPPPSARDPDGCGMSSRRQGGWAASQRAPANPSPSSLSPSAVVLAMAAGLAAVVTRAPIWAWISAVCLASGVSRFSLRASERSGLAYAAALTASAFAFAYVPALQQGPSVLAAFTGRAGRAAAA